MAGARRRDPARFPSLAAGSGVGGDTGHTQEAARPLPSPDSAAERGGPGLRERPELPAGLVPGPWGKGPVPGGLPPPRCGSGGLG